MVSSGFEIQIIMDDGSGHRHKDLRVERGWVSRFVPVLDSDPVSQLWSGTLQHYDTLCNPKSPVNFTGLDRHCSMDFLLSGLTETNTQGQTRIVPFEVI